METNETILTRSVVVIDSRKKLGAVKSLRVDCDTLAVCHYLVTNDGTGSQLALPFKNALAVGDTFLTVQSLSDFLPVDEKSSTQVIQDGFALIGTEVYAKTGNKLGTVSTFEFDPVYGTVTKILVGGQAAFDAAQFVFFSPEFVFVDDGVATAQELRSGGVAPAVAAEVTAAAPVVVVEQVIEPVVEEPAEAEAAIEEPEAEAEEAAEAEAVEDEAAEEAVEEIEEAATDAEPEVEADAEAELETELEAAPEVDAAAEVETVATADDEVVSFLIGATLTDDVESDDGEFKVAKGTELTAEIIASAQEHDALLLLTINVDI